MSVRLDEVTLRYGKSRINLTKSRSLVAVKPELKAAGIRPLFENPAQAGLAGFEILDYTACTMEARLDTLRDNPAVGIGSHVYHTSQDEIPFIPTGKLYLVFGDDMPPERCTAIIERYHLEFVSARRERELIVRVTAASANPLKVAAALQRETGIAVAEPDLATPGRLMAFTLPQDILLMDQWHLQNTGYHRGTSMGFKKAADARVVEAWAAAQTLGTPEIILAIIDDGFDLSHPDISGENKIVAPYDFRRRSADPLPGYDDMHGTACAGVAVGNAQGSGIVGAAPNCRLMPLRWGSSLSDEEVCAWFDYVRQSGARVLSCSWAAEASHYILSTMKRQAIADCARKGGNGKGVVICFAASNSNVDINDPSTTNGFATHPDVMAVAASTSMDMRSHYSGYGDSIWVCAPSSGQGGWGILTSDVNGTFINSSGQWVEAGYSKGSFTYDFGGTSSACPLVAGICALLLSVDPSLSAFEIKELVRDTARRIGDPEEYHEGHSRFYGYGCIDAHAAVRRLLSRSSQQ